jgi:MFS family permease
MMLLILRVVLGLGESVMLPASFKILACEALEGQRGRANGWMAAGQQSGPAFGTLVCGLLMAWFGWPAVFVAAGCLSLLWLWPWLRTPRATISAPATLATPDGPPSRTLLRSRELWGSCLGNFGFAYAFYLVLSWLPVYLVKTHGLTMAQMAPLGAGIFALSAATSVLTGWASDRWFKAGASSNRVRKTALLAGFAGLVACLCACAFAGPLGDLASMTGCGVFLGMLVPASWASAQTLAGPGAAARWYGIQNFCANVGGISAPIITGVVVDRTGNFSLAFLVAAGVALVGMLAYGVIVRRIEPVDWCATNSLRPTHRGPQCRIEPAK